MMLRQSIVISVVVSFAAVAGASAQPRERASTPGPLSSFSQILGRPTDKSVTVSLLSAQSTQAFIEYGTASGHYSVKTATKPLPAGVPVEFELTGLKPASATFYRVQIKLDGADKFAPKDEARVTTARAPGQTFTFALQGDSHPERPGKMYDPELYALTMNNVAKNPPDFYLLMGDDFSIERLIERKALSQPAVDAIYAHQRGFLGIIGRSTPIFLVNGNHEQAAKYLLDGTANNAAVFAGKARTAFYPLPAPDSFYTGNAEPVEYIGLLRDYYAWTWGDALFVVIDPYWHSDVAVDNEAGAKAPQPDAGREPGKGGGKQRDKGNAGAPNGNEQEQPTTRRGKGQRDLWQITLGDKQYRWLERTLTQSHAKYKFVFSHHVLGTGRGGVEQATKFEWGGNDQRGVTRFAQMRPQWEKPIHALMRDSGVTIFFQGHDHIYARQELDGVVYQSVPNPADPTFTAFNREAYKSGDILPNSGHLRVTVSPESAKVEYVRSFRPGDENDQNKNMSVAHSYTLIPHKQTMVKGKPTEETKK